MASRYPMRPDGNLRESLDVAETFGETVKWPTQPSMKNHTVLCGGGIVFGPEPIRLLITMAILLVPFVLLVIFVFPHAPPGLGWASIGSFVLCKLCLVRVATKDPGVVPIRSEAPNVKVPSMDRVTMLRDDVTQSCCVASGSVVEFRMPAPTDPLPPPGVFKFNTIIKYCHTCNRYRGPRTFHCNTCNRCIDIYDHHCPWIGTCVGAYNYHNFLMFLFSHQLTLFLALAMCIVTPVLKSSDEDISITDALTDMAWMPVVVFLYVYALGMPASVLTLFHCWLVSHGCTTLEHLRRQYTDGRVPYDDGCCNNWRRLFGKFDPVALSDRFRASLVLAVGRLQERFDAKKREPMGNSVDGGSRTTSEYGMRRIEPSPPVDSDAPHAVGGDHDGAVSPVDGDDGAAPGAVVADGVTVNDGGCTLAARSGLGIPELDAVIVGEEDEPSEPQPTLIPVVAADVSPGARRRSASLASDQSLSARQQQQDTPNHVYSAPQSAQPSPAFSDVQPHRRPHRHPSARVHRSAGGFAHSTDGLPGAVHHHDVTPTATSLASPTQQHEAA